MIRSLLWVCLPFLLLHCSRKGENPLPQEPIQPRSAYDLEATYLVFRTVAGGSPTTTFRVGQDFWTGFQITNVGLQTIPREAIDFAMYQDGKAVVPRSRWEWVRNRSSLTPGASWKGGSSPPHATVAGGVNSRRWTFTRKPGIYELNLEVYLHPRYEEENKDNNEFILTVEVKE